MTKIFISYSRKDIDFARKLAGDLEKAERKVEKQAEQIRQGGTIPRGGAGLERPALRSSAFLELPAVGLLQFFCFFDHPAVLYPLAHHFCMLGGGHGWDGHQIFKLGGVASLPSGILIAYCFSSIATLVIAQPHLPIVPVFGAAHMSAES